MAWRIPAHIKSILKDCDLPWEIEKRKRHRLLRISGEVVMALPSSPKEGGRHVQNNIREVKRAIERLS